MRIYFDQREGKGSINRPEKTTRLKKRWGRLVGKTTWYKTKRERRTQAKVSRTPGRKQSSRCHRK